MERKTNFKDNLSLETTIERKLYFFNHNPIFKENPPIQQKNLICKKKNCEKTPP